MIDKLVFRCDFLKTTLINGVFSWDNFQLAALGVPLEQSIDSNGLVFNTRHPWESIPSSYESMAFKIFDHRYDPLDMFYIEIKASPAKLMQGHNVYGSDDIYDCSMHLLELLCTTYPQLAERLDHSTWSLSQIDITYSSRAVDDREARLFINSLQNVSFGQTKSRTGYDGTAYFGKKNSRLKKIKVYLKSAEVVETVKKNDKRKDGDIYNEVYIPELLNFSTGLIRWEVSLYHRYFERLGISTKLKDIFKNQTLTPTYLQKYWRLATHDLFTALKGQHMKLINDTEIQDALRVKYSKVSDKTGKVSTALADSAFRTYRDIRRDGWDIAGSLTSRVTFHRHVKMLTECGLSRAALQNMNGLDDGAQIIPFVRFIEVDFGSQFPEGYQQPAPKHVYQPQPTTHLRLVA
jgi:II/X family phage/plasmid replication protein